MGELSFSEVLSAIKDLGLTGFLIVSVWLFIKGKLWPVDMVDKALDAQSDLAQKNSELLCKELGKEVAQGVKNGIAEGIAEGYLKINNKDA